MADNNQNAQGARGSLKRLQNKDLIDDRTRKRVKTPSNDFDISSDEYADDFLDNLSDEQLISLGVLKAQQGPNNHTDSGDAAGNRSNNAILSPAIQSHTAKASAVKDEYEADFLDNMDLEEIDEILNQPHKEWWEDKSKIYFLNPAKSELGNAFAYMNYYADKPYEKDIALIKSDWHGLSVTRQGAQALADVSMLISQHNGDYYKPLRHDEIKGKKFADIENLYGKENTFIRSHDNSFKSIENYNKIFNTKYQTNAALARFSAIVGESDRKDIPKIIVRVSDNIFENAETYVTEASNRIIHGKQIFVLSTNGKSYHSPDVAKLQNPEYFSRITKNEQLRDALDSQLSRRHSPLPPVLVHEDGKLINAAEKIKIDHDYYPLIERYEKHDIFIQNSKNGKYTGNYRTFSGLYHEMTLDQAKTLGMHPATEREREAQIPHFIDDYGVKVRLLPPAAVDEGLLDRIAELNKGLEEAGHTIPSGHFNLEEALNRTARPMQSARPVQRSEPDNPRGLDHHDRQRRDRTR